MKSRILIVAFFLIFLFSAVIYQFYKLQIVQHEKWVKEGSHQHERIVHEPFHRGVFFSNCSIKEGHPLKKQPFVVDVLMFHLYIDPSQIPTYAKNEMAIQLSTFLGCPLEQISGEFDRKSRSRRLYQWIDSDTRAKISTWWEKYAKDEKILRNSLFFVPDYKRSYPFGKLLGQVLHTIRDDKDEKTKEGLPTGGLELRFNEFLKGKLGKRLLVHSPRNPLELGQVLEAPEDGADIELTINHCLQAIAEEEIAKGVQKAKAKCGWAVMMDPYTGEILALAQYPFFDPSKYRDYFNDPKLIEHTKVKAITDANEIGSIMKPLTLAIALRANEKLKAEGKAPLFSMNEKIDTSNGSFPGRKKLLKDVHFHHFLNGYMAIQKSSNIYVAKLVDRIIKTFGNEYYRSELERFGFGQKTGIELPGEVKGLLPQIGKRHPSGALEWSTPTPYSLAMGHNIQATTVQMLRAFAMVANGGFDVKPTLIRKIIKNGEIIIDNTTKPIMENRVLEDNIVHEVVKAMKYSTKPGGTSRRADIYGFTDAGKTGTAEKIVNGTYSKSNYFSSFIGFAPVENPRFVLMIAMDEPEAVYISGVGRNNQGANCAAPVFREIGKRTLEYLGVAPDDPYGYPVGDPRRDSKLADWGVEVENLQKLYEKWNGKHEA